MATFAESAVGTTNRTPTHVIDRWIYVFVAALLIAVVLLAFVPDSVRQVAAVQAGQRPPFPLVLHVHASLMGSWLVLLLAQTLLVALRRPAWHKQLGIASFVLAPALVIIGFLLVPVMQMQLVDAIRTGPPEVGAQLRPVLDTVFNIMLLQIRTGVVFAVSIGLAIWARRHDTGLHKRLMILGTISAMPAATDRMLWLPTTLPGNPFTADLWPLLLIAPMFAWDLYRLGRVHGAYWIYLGLSLGLAVPIYLLWGTPLWRGIAAGMLGVPGI